MSMILFIYVYIYIFFISVYCLFMDMGAGQYDQEADDEDVQGAEAGTCPRPSCFQFSAPIQHQRIEALELSWPMP